MLANSYTKNNNQSKKWEKKVSEILDYKKKIQAYIIHFERLRNWDMIHKLEDADTLLDQNLKDFLPESEIKLLFSV